MLVQVADMEKLSRRLVEFYDKIAAWEHDVAKDSGLSPAQMHTIEIVGHNLSLRMKELAARMGVTTGTLTVMVDRLEEQGYLRRTPHETDRRSWLIQLTEKGQMIFVQHHQHHLRLTEEITLTLSVEEREMFSDILEKIARQM